MKTYDQLCALALALERIEGRWTLLIVRELLTGPKRFSEMRAMLTGIAPNLLAQRLEEMVDSGLIEKGGDGSRFGSYRLTALGHALEETVSSLVRWGGAFVPQAMRKKGTLQSPHWLVVALKALLEKKLIRARVTGQVVVDSFFICVKAAPGEAPAIFESRVANPDFTVTVDYRNCLALFSGAIPSWRKDDRISVTGNSGSLAVLLG